MEMMPSGMMPTWDSGSMWLLMLLPTLVLVVGIIIVVVFLLQRERQPNTVQAAAFSPPKPQTDADANSSIVPAPESKAGSDIVGKVVLSLAPTLMDDERRVMDELAKSGGEMLQSDLPDKTGYSKATVSKVIRSLETRAIIVREPHRWTYWCRVNPRLIERVQKVPSA